MRLIICSQAILVLLIAFAHNSLPATNDDQELWEAARRELAQRTREYIRRNPISDELRSFIEELTQHKRKKRQDSKNMYAIKDGDIVPLARLEEQFNTESNLGGNFTVVPLIIPIALENTMTLKERTETTDSDNFGRGSEKAILGRGKVLSAIKDKNRAAQNDNSGTEETVVDSLVDEKLKSTSVSSKLDNILEDIQNLVSAEKKGKGSGKEGALCNVSGHWDSESGGMLFHIKKTNTGAAISMKPREPPSDDGFIVQDKWNVTAKFPFPHSGQVIITLTAHKGKRVALFLGECRVCEGSETITGDWLVGRTSTDCKDQKASHSYISDIFRRNNVETLREAHLNQLSTLTTSGTSTEMSEE